MFKIIITKLTLLALLVSGWAFAQTSSPYPFSEGYYKEMLVNNGPGIASSNTIDHAEALAWRYDHVSLSASDVNQDRFFALMAGREDDHNGLLLFPDGSPRYRIMTVGGADTNMNGDFIGGTQGAIMTRRPHPIRPHLLGYHMIQDFVKGGGGYAGFCAGMQLIGQFGIKPTGIQTFLYPIPPGTTLNRFVGDYASDHGFIPNVLQWGGTYILNYDSVTGLDQVATMSTPWNRGSRTFGASWFYNNPNQADAGRLFLSGVHPEMNRDAHAVGVVSQWLVETIAGNNGPSLKKELANGEEHLVYENTFSAKRDQIKIGDGQYHHYRIRPAHGQKYLRVTLQGDAGFDLHLFVHKGDYAFKGYNTAEDRSSGASKVMAYDQLTGGDWYISVKGASLPDEDYLTTDADIAMLNGVGYSLEVTWSDQPFCEGGVENLVVTSQNECSGDPLFYQFFAGECAAGANVNLTLVDGNGTARANLGTKFATPGQNSGYATTPAALAAGTYFLRVTDAAGNQTLSNSVQIRPKQFTDASTHGSEFESGDAVSLSWQSSCNMEGSTAVILKNQAGSEVTRVYTNRSTYGLNRFDFQLNQSAGVYFFTIQSGSARADTAPFTIVQSEIKRVWSHNDPLVVGHDLTVSWEVTAGFTQPGSLSLHDARGALLKTLSTSASMSAGVHTATYRINIADLGNSVPDNGVYLRLRAEGQTRDSAVFVVTKALGEWMMALPTTLYDYQTLTLRYRQNALLDGNTVLLRYVNIEGQSLASHTISAGNAIGEHEVTIPVIPVNPRGIQLQMRLESASGTVLLTSSPFTMVQPTLEVTNEAPNGFIMWDWRGETCQVRIQITDLETGQDVLEHEMTQVYGFNMYQLPYRDLIQKGKTYRLRVATKGRLRTIYHDEAFRN